VSKFHERVGTFDELFENRAVALPNGKLAVEDSSSIPFVLGTVSDPRDASDPAPPSAKRISLYDARVTAAGGTEPTYSVALLGAKHDAHLLGGIVVSAPSVRKHIKRYGKSLHYVYGHQERAANVIEKACGDGLALAEGLKDMAKKATPAERALAAAELDRIRSAGLSGEATILSLADFLKRYGSLAHRVQPREVQCVGRGEGEQRVEVRRRDVRLGCWVLRW